MMNGETTLEPLRRRQSFQRRSRSTRLPSMRPHHHCLRKPLMLRPLKLWGPKKLLICTVPHQRSSLTW